MCIATVADSSQKLFQHYYSHFMPHLKHILISAQDVSLQMLRGKTMECISLIGVAVGREMVRGSLRSFTAAMPVGVVPTNVCGGFSSETTQSM